MESRSCSSIAEFERSALFSITFSTRPYRKSPTVIGNKRMSKYETIMVFKTRPRLLFRLPGRRPGIEIMTHSSKKMYGKTYFLNPSPNGLANPLIISVTPRETPPPLKGMLKFWVRGIKTPELIVPNEASRQPPAKFPVRKVSASQAWSIRSMHTYLDCQ